MAGGHVVTRPYIGSGIGANLASLAGAVWIAAHLGRTLVVDWRGMDVLKDKQVNVFTRFLARVDELEGVPVVYAGEPDVLDVGFPADAAPETVWLTAAEAGAILRGERVLDASVLALESYHGLERIEPSLDAREIREFVRRVYGRIAPADRLQQEIDTWLAHNVDDVFLAGVNVRTGNGDFARGSLPRARVDVSIINDEAKFLRKVRRACAARARGHADHVIFFASDSRYGHDLLSRLPNSVTRRTRFPPPGAGVHVTAQGDDEAAVEDSIIDMFLLARCDSLVYNFSMFSFYARIVTDEYGGNALNIERTYARFWLRAPALVVRRSASRLRRG